MKYTFLLNTQLKLKKKTNNLLKIKIFIMNISLSFCKRNISMNMYSNKIIF